MDKEKDKVVEYSVVNENDLWKPFSVKVHKGKVIWCSDRGHPEGASWDALKHYYEQLGGDLKCEIKEVKENAGD